jgi:hypothetical protein
LGQKIIKGDTTKIKRNIMLQIPLLKKQTTEFEGIFSFVWENATTFISTSYYFDNYLQMCH